MGMSAFNRARKMSQTEESEGIAPEEQTKNKPKGKTKKNAVSNASEISDSETPTGDPSSNDLANDEPGA